MNDGLIAAGQAARDGGRMRQLRAMAARGTLLQRLRAALRPAALAGPGRGRALIVDNDWPRPDRDAGSVEIVAIVQALDRLGFDTRLGAILQHGGAQPARDRLAAAGLRCLGPADAPSVADWLARHGAGLDLVVLCRVFAGGSLLEQVQRDAPCARILFDTIDLNWVREERRALLTNDAALLALRDDLRAREEHVAACSDATLVVSEAELRLLQERLPGSLVVHMPLARAIRPPRAGFAARHGIGFIGGFGHMPNVDAVRSFLADTWPLVRARLPGCTFSIAGPDAPDGLAGAAPGVRLLGHVADDAAWFESLRATVAPLRFGSGAKGKVASSLAAGVPCVLTPMAAEGMRLTEADGVLIAEDPTAFAAAVETLCTDAATWQRSSAGAVAYARRELAPEAWQGRLDAALKRLGC